MQKSLRLDTDVQLERAIIAGDACGALAVLGEGERDVDDQAGDLTDDLPELLDAETVDVFPADR